MIVIAASDMADNKLRKYPGFKQVWRFELGQDVLWLQWHAQAPALLAGTAEGQVSQFIFSGYFSQNIFSSPGVGVESGWGWRGRE